jgi:hypothetical protein
MRAVLTASFLVFLCAAAFAQSSAPPVRPLAVTDAGAWEAVVWGRGQRVNHCTLSRARNAPPAISYGFLIDSEVIILGLESPQWAFKARTLRSVLKPETGTVRAGSAQAASPTRANILLEQVMLDAFQRSQHVDIEIEDKKARLPFDGFDAARAVLDKCVRQLGKDYRP